MHDFLKCGVNASRPAHHWRGLVFLGHRNIAGAYVILLPELTASLENAVNEREVFSAILCASRLYPCRRRAITTIYCKQAQPFG